MVMSSCVVSPASAESVAHTCTVPASSAKLVVGGRETVAADRIMVILLLALISLTNHEENDFYTNKGKTSTLIMGPSEIQR